jgi:nucleotide-binding universal stress UspA family protein
MRVLIAIDGSPSSRAVVEQVALRSWPPATELCVLTVVDPYIYEQALARIPEAKKFAPTMVEEAAEGLRSPGRQVSTSVIQGHPASSIVGAAEKWAADFVVIGSHGLGRVARFLLGSTALAVVRKAPCSVEIVRGLPEKRKDKGKPGLRILLATDGSECSVAAVRSVAERPWPAGTEVHVLSVPPFVELELGISNPELVKSLRKTSVTQAQEAVAGALAILREARLKAEGTVPMVFDSPKVLILEKAKKWKAHLIVVGSHGRRGLDRYLMGSVSEAVAMHAHCSVEVVRIRHGRKEKEK